MQLLTWLSTYLIIIVCELGDKTQLAVLLLTGNNPHKKWVIFAASSVALILSVFIEVTVGITLARYIGPALINKAAGMVFLVLGIFMLIKYIRLPLRLPVWQRKQSESAEPEPQGIESNI